MRASQTVLPFKLTASDESLTAHAGLVLFDEYLGAMGIAALIDHEAARCWQCRRVWSIGARLASCPDARWWRADAGGPTHSAP